MREARQHFPDFDVTRSWELPHAPVLPGDETLEAYLRRIGFTEAQLDYTQRGFAGAAAEAMRSISAQSSLDEMHDLTAGEGDYRVVNGYNQLHHTLANGLDIRLNTPISSVEWHGDGVRVTAVNGDVFAADRVIITLPLGVLKAGRVQFTPSLPAEKQQAIDTLLVGPAIKLVYRFTEPVLPPGIMALYSALTPCMWWSPSFGRDCPDQIVTAFATGDRARALLALGEQGALEAGAKVLSQELERPVHPVEMRLVNWVDDPYSLGGYTVTPPGGVDLHAVLAQPDSGKLYWAGEHTAGHLWKATVHGAYASGRRAASEILAKA